MAKRKTTTVPSLSPTDFVYVVNKYGVVVCNATDNKVSPIGTITPDDFIEALQKRTSVNTGILPKDCLYMESKVITPDNTKYLFIFEFEPKTIPYLFGKITKNIALPYVQFYIRCEALNGKYIVSDSRISCSNRPVFDNTTTTYSLPLHNIWEDGRICWGRGGAITQQKDETIGQFARRVALNFFVMPATNELGPNWPTEFSNYDEWESLTKANPQFILKTKFRGSEAFGRIVDKLGIK